MSDYVIITDSSCDLSESFCKKLGIIVVPLSYTIDGHEYQNLQNMQTLEEHEFYEKLRAGNISKTSAANVELFENAMTGLLEAGKDILYIGFSTGLSATYNAGEIAAEMLREKYPERRIYTVDSLAASMGQGLLVWYAVRQKEAGKSIEEVRDYTESIKLHICHQFTVEDLKFLHRGGRISKTTAIVGGLIGIMPLMHVDNEGHLIKIGIARGRKKALQALVDAMEKKFCDPDSSVAFISHGDCLEDAQYVEKLVRERLGIKYVEINYVGPVIGSHSGPGTLALFFMGSER